MIETSFLDRIPIWALYILTFLVILLAFEIGHRIGLFRIKKSKTKAESNLDSMVGATLGLLAFLMAFVVSMAVDRFDNRRQLVMDEAVAIRNAYLQAGYLVEPFPGEIRAILSEYVDLRLAAPDAGSDIYQVIARSEEIHRELWSLAEEVVATTPARDEVSMFVGSVNEVINQHARRSIAVLITRLPATIVLGLYMIAIFCLALVGYQQSFAGKRNLFSVLVMAFIFTVVMMLIIDLDRAQEGFLQVNQQAMIDLQRQIGMMKP